jgi:hypothetical protein
MKGRVYLVLLVVLLALAATGVYLRQRAKGAEAAALRQGPVKAADCETPAPPPVPSKVEGPPPKAPPPTLPGFTIEAACGAEAPKGPAKGKGK